MPTDRPHSASQSSPLAVIWGLFGISIVGLALGAFVLPNVLPASAESIPPHYDPGPIQIGDAAPPPPVVAATAPPVAASVVQPAPQPAHPHPLDAPPTSEPP